MRAVPPTSRAIPRSRRTSGAVAALASVGLLVGAGCTSSGTSTTGTPGGSTVGSTRTGGTSGTSGTNGTSGTTPGSVLGIPASSTCVTDPDAVIAAKASPDAATAALPADLVAKLDEAAASSFTQAAAPGAIVGVRTAEGTWTSAYGEADPATGAPMAVGMHTRIGSVTKTFTGTLLLQLVEEGKVALDDPISRYVDGIPNGDTVTLRLLANMTSGVASYTRNPSFTDVYFDKPETIFTTDELVAAGVAKSPLFAPGEKFDYSNTNTVLLGLVIEKVTGQPIAEVLTERIEKPLGLTGTSFPGTSTDIPEPFPQGFTLQGNAATTDNPSNATHWNPAWGWTAGEMISTMDDLLVYGRALGTGQGLLDPATQKERLTSFPGAKGYGLAMGCIDGWVGHTGELPGYNTSVFYDTTADTIVIVQVNSDIASGDCEESPTLVDDPRDAECSAPATRMFVALSKALGHEFTPNPAS